MSKRQYSPFRADVVGSFLRPERLKEARKNFEANKISKEELTKIEDELITDLVEKQKKAGLQSITDGEFRRITWHLDFFWGLEGVDHVVLEHGYKFHDEETIPDSAKIVGKVGFNPNHPFFEHFKFLKSIAGEGVSVRQTIPAPAQFFRELTRDEAAVNKIYEDRRDLLEDIAKAYNLTIRKFYELGCRSIQLDDCTWGMLCDREYTNRVYSNYSFHPIMEMYLELNNKALENLPEDLIITTHICRGNYHSTYSASGSYEPVAPYVLAKENVNAFFLEFDTERAGGFEPLRFVKKDAIVVLGLITSKFPKLEDKEAIKERIREATKYVPLDRLCLSPQCGFASCEVGNKLTENEQWAKVALVKEIVAEVWGE